MMTTGWRCLRERVGGALRHPRGRDLTILAIVVAVDAVLLAHGGSLAQVGRGAWPATVSPKGSLGLVAGLGALFLVALAVGRRSGRAGSPTGTEPLESMVSEFQRTLEALEASHRQLSRLCHRAGRTVEDLESYNRQILASITSGVINFTMKGVVTVVNPAARRILHLRSSASPVGRSAEEIWGPDSPLTGLVEETLAHPRNRSRLELRLSSTEGAEMWVGLNVSVLRGRDRKPAGVTLLMSDLTEVRRLRRELGIRQRLAAMGELTACIAHNFRNSLAAVLGYATIIERRLDHDDKNRRSLQAIKGEAHEMEQGIRGLLEGLGKEDSALGMLDLGEVVREALGGLGPELEDKKVELTLSLPVGLPPVKGDAAALGQLVANLVRNSVEAMPGGGCLRVGLEPLPRVSPETSPSESLWGGERRELLLTVTDTGVGIPPELTARVFETFFTTREGGSGLGLALAKGTVERHGGRIELESRPGVGTTLRLYFPVGEISSDGR